MAYSRHVMKRTLRITPQIRKTAAILALGLAWGCERSSVPPPQPPDGEPAAEAAAPILLWHTFDDASIPALLARVEAFRHAHPDIEVQLQSLAFNAAREAFLNAAEQGNPPDLFRAEVSWTHEFAARDLLADLDAWLTQADLDDYMPAALAQASWQGRQVGLPQEADCLALFYNKRLLAQAQLDPPESMHDFAAAAPMLHDPVRGHFAFYLRADGYWMQPFLYSFGAELVDPLTDKPGIHRRDRAEQAMAFILELRDTHHAFPVVTDFDGDYERMMAGFVEGRYAMILNGPWALEQTLKGVQFVDPDNLGIAPIPRGPGGSISSLGGHNWVIAKQSRQPRRAMLLAAFLNSAESQEQFALARQGLPTRRSAYERPALKNDPLVQAFRAVLDTARPRPASPHGAKLYAEMTAACQALLLGKESPRSCVERIDRAWKTISP